MSLLQIASLLGFSIPQLLALGAMGTAAITLKSYNGIKSIKTKLLNDKEQEMRNSKKQIEVNSYDEKLELDNAAADLELKKIKLEQKQREINNYRLVECTADKVIYNKIAPKSNNELLIGYNGNYEPIWITSTNLIIGGTTNCGKSRLIYSLLLNYLGNHQGTCYIADLKGVDFKLFRDKVDMYIDELEHVQEVIEAFRTEYEKRKELLAKGNYIDIKDYNNHNPNTQLKQFLLLIDECADLTDVYTKYHKPIGCYATLIEMARKCRAFGGRIILATQRTSVDVIIGTLKANCHMFGLRTVSELNSKIIIDCPGCERLEEGEALTYINGNLTKIFAYYIDDFRLRNLIKAL